MKIGALGGTFDPVHNGHIMMAEQALETLGLDKVLLIPAGTPMSRPGGNITPPGHRLMMLRRAVAGKPRLNVSIMELDRPGPSYTVDTMQELRRRYGAEADIYFILGSDNLESLKDWREPETLISLCRLAVIPRPGYPPPEPEALDRAVPGLSKRVVFMEHPVGDISASAVRELVAQGQLVDHLVPETVAEYIHALQLYTGGTE